MGKRFKRGLAIFLALVMICTNNISLPNAHATEITGSQISASASEDGTQTGSKSEKNTSAQTGSKSERTTPAQTGSKSEKTTSAQTGKNTEEAVSIQTGNNSEGAASTQTGRNLEETTEVISDSDKSDSGVSTGAAVVSRDVKNITDITNILDLSVYGVTYKDNNGVSKLVKTSSGQIDLSSAASAEATALKLSLGFVARDKEQDGESIVAGDTFSYKLPDLCKVEDQAEAKSIKNRTSLDGNQTSDTVIASYTVNNQIVKVTFTKKVDENTIETLIGRIDLDVTVDTETSSEIAITLQNNSTTIYLPKSKDTAMPGKDIVEGTEENKDTALAEKDKSDYMDGSDGENINNNIASGNKESNSEESDSKESSNEESDSEESGSEGSDDSKDSNSITPANTNPDTAADVMKEDPTLNATVRGILRKFGLVKSGSGKDVTAEAGADKGKLSIAADDFYYETKDERFAFSKEDSGYKIPDNVSFTDVVNVGFSLDFALLENTPNRTIQSGDYFVYDLANSCDPSGIFYFPENKSGTLSTRDGNVIADYTIDKATQKLTITFSEAVNNDQWIDAITGGADLSLGVDAAKLQGGTPKDVLVKVPGDNDGTHLSIPGIPDSVSGITKNGRLNTEDNSIEWTITVGEDSLGASLKDIQIVEDFGEYQTYESAKLMKNEDGTAITFDKATDGTYTYTFGDVTAPQTIKVKTYVTKAALTAQKDDITNNVSMKATNGAKEPTGQIHTSDTVTEHYPRVSKQGRAINSNEIEWTLVTNNTGDAPRTWMYEAEVTDVLPAGLRYKDGTLEVTKEDNTKLTVPVYTSAAEAAGKDRPYATAITAGDESTDIQTLKIYYPTVVHEKYNITFRTTVDKGALSDDVGETDNAATISAKIPQGGTGPGPGIDWGTGPVETEWTQVSVEKTVECDEKTGILTWHIQPATRIEDYTDAVITDTINENQTFIEGSIVITNNGVPLSADAFTSVIEGTSDPDLKFTFPYDPYDKLDDIFITYQTKAKGFFEHNNIAENYNNVANIVLTKNGKEYTDTDQADVTVKNNFLEKKITYEFNDAEQKGYFHYAIAVNGNQMNLTNVKIEDNLANASVVAEKEGEEDVNIPFADFDVAGIGSKTDSTFKCFVEDITDNADATQTAKLTVDASGLVKAQWDSIGGHQYMIHIYTSLKSDARAKYAGKTLTAKNTVTGTTDQFGDNTFSDTTTGEGKQGTQDGTYLLKDGVLDSSKSFLTWTVDINQNAEKISEPYITDTIPSCLKYDRTSVKLYEAKHDATGSEIIGTLGDPVAITPIYTVDKNGTTTMKINLPKDAQSYRLTYSTDIIANAPNSTVNNTVGLYSGTDKIAAVTQEEQVDNGSWANGVTKAIFSIKKTDSLSTANVVIPVEYAIYGLYSDAACGEDHLVDTAMTQEDGTCSFIGEKNKSYWIKEISSPVGYDLNTTAYEVTAEKPGIQETVSVTDVRTVETQKTGTAEITKSFYDVDATAITGQQAVFKLTLLPKTGSAYETPVQVKEDVTGTDGVYTFVTTGTETADPGSGSPVAITDMKNATADGKLNIKKLPWGRYKLTEISTADGFIALKDPVYFEVGVSTDGTSTTTTYEFGTNAGSDKGTNGVIANTSNKVTLTKNLTGDAAFGTGAAFILYNEDGITPAVNAVTQVAFGEKTITTTENNGNVITFDNLKSGTYVLKETTNTDAKLTLAKDITFTIDEYGVVKVNNSEKADQNLTMSDGPVSFNVQKKDQFSRWVLGADIRVKNTEGTPEYNEIKSTTNDGEDLTFTGLVRGGTYIVTEDVTPSGYYKAEAMTVTMKADGTGIETVTCETGDKTENYQNKKVSNSTLLLRDVQRTATLKLTKVDQTDPNQTIEDIHFKLYKYTGNYDATTNPGKCISVNANNAETSMKTEENGVLDLETAKALDGTNLKNDDNKDYLMSSGLLKGSYYLKEVEGGNSYNYKIAEPIFFTVEEDTTQTTAPTGKPGNLAGGARVVIDTTSRSDIQVDSYTGAVTNFTLSNAKWSKSLSLVKEGDNLSTLAGSETANGDMAGKSVLKGTIFKLHYEPEFSDYDKNASDTYYAYDGTNTAAGAGSSTATGLWIQCTSASDATPVSGAVALAKIDISEKGTYTLTETKAADGYILPYANGKDTLFYTFKVDDTDQGDLVIKSGNLTGTAGGGSDYELKASSVAASLAADGNLTTATGVKNVQPKLNIKKTGTDGTTPISNVILKINGIFAGYTAAKTIYVKTGTDGFVTVCSFDKTFSNNASAASLDGLLLNGQTYTITEDADSAPTKVTSGTVKVKYDAANNGTLTEVSDSLNTASVNAGTNTLTIKNVETRFTIDKVNASGNRIVGAAFELYEAEKAEDDTYTQKGDAIRTWTSALTEAEDFTGLASGKYYMLKEAKAPYGYKRVTDPVVFRLENDNTVTIVSGDTGSSTGGNTDSRVTITDDGKADKTTSFAGSTNITIKKISLKNEPLQLNLKKTDKDGTELTDSGIVGRTTFTLTGNFADGTGTKDTSASTVTFTYDTTKKTFTTSQIDRKLVQSTDTVKNVYTLKEITPPAGYKVAGESYFIIDENGIVSITDAAGNAIANEEVSAAKAEGNNSIAVISVKDEKNKFSVTKSLEDNTNNVGKDVDKDAVFALFTKAQAGANGTPIWSGTTDKTTGRITIEGVMASKVVYELREITAPKGYELAESSYYAMDEEGQLYKMTGFDDTVFSEGKRAADNSVTVTDTPIRLNLAKIDGTGASVGAEEIGYAAFEIAGTFRTKTSPVTVDLDPAETSNTMAALDNQWIAGETYVLTETSTPYGYLDLPGSVKFTIGTDGAIVTDSSGKIADESGNAVDNPRYTDNADKTKQTEAAAVSADKLTLKLTNLKIAGHVAITKTESGTTTRIPGVTFELYKVKTAGTTGNDTKIATGITTDHSGYWTSAGSTIQRLDDTTKILGEGLEEGSYYFKEIRTQDTYYNDEAATYPFTITEDDDAATNRSAAGGITLDGGGKILAKNQLTITNTRMTAKLNLTKYDTENGDAISNKVETDNNAGAKFTLTKTSAFDATKKTVYILATDADGKLYLESIDGKAVTGTPEMTLEKGDYTLVETTAPKGYALSDAEGNTFNITFTVTDAEMGKTLEIKKENLSTDASPKPFNLRASDKVVQEYLTSKESNTASGSGSSTVAGTAGVYNNRLTTTVLLYKVDSEDTTAKLNNAKFKLEKQTTSTGFMGWLSDLLTGKKYSVIDGTLAPQNNDNGLLTLTDLDYGTYKITETQSPDGYKLDDEEGNAPTITFTIDRANAGENIILTYDNDSIESTDENPYVENVKTDIHITKTDLETGVAVAGADLSLSGTFADGTASPITWNTTTTPDKELKGKLTVGQSYTLTETNRVTGYESFIGKSVIFTVDTKGNIVLADSDNPALTDTTKAATVTSNTTLNLRNTKVHGSVILTKTDAKTKAVMKDMTFELYKGTVDGIHTRIRETENLKTDTNGQLKVENLEEGEYYFKETSTPVEYLVNNNTYPFHIGYVAEGTEDEAYKPDVNVAVTNTPLEVSMDLYKYYVALSGAKNPIKGATFKLEYAPAKTGTYEEVNERIVTGASGGADSGSGSSGSGSSGSGSNGSDVSKADGSATVSGLKRGWYRLTETGADGYVYSDATGKPFSCIFEVKDSDQNTTIHINHTTAEGVDKAGCLTSDGIENTPITTSLTLKKTDETYGNTISEVTFHLSGQTYYGETYTMDQTSGTDGIMTFTNIPLGSYTLTETGKPDDYKTPVNVYDVNVTRSQTNTAVATVKLQGDTDDMTAVSGAYVLTNEKKYADITFTKYGTDDEKDLTHKSVLAGAVFGLYSNEACTIKALGENGQPIANATSDASGKVTFHHVYVGTYYIKEESAPKNYEVNTDIYKAMITNEGEGTFDGIYAAAQAKTDQITNQAVRGSISLTKVDSKDSTKILAGVTFKIYKGTQVIDTKKTDGEGKLTFEDLLMDTRYTIRETATLSNYFLSETTQTVTLTEENNGKDIDLGNWTNAPTTFTFKKIQTTKEPLPDCKFGLYDGSTLLEEATSNGEGNVTFAYFNKNNTYTIKELEVPDGFFVNPNTFSLVVDANGDAVLKNNGQDITEVMNDDKGSITLTKTAVDRPGKEENVHLQGAVFVLKDKEGNVVDTQTTDDKGELIFKDLAMGSYSIMESKAPDGYVLSDAVTEVTLSRGEAAQNVKVNRTNDHADFYFNKQVSYMESCYAPSIKSTLSNASFVLYTDEECSKAYAQATSDEEGKVAFSDIETGTYYMKEVVTEKTPSRLAVNKTVYKVIVDEAGKTIVEDTIIADDVGKTTAEDTIIVDDVGKTTAEDTIIVNDVVRADIQLQKVNEQNKSEVIPDSTYGLFRKANLTLNQATGNTGEEGEVTGDTGQEVTSDGYILIATAKTDSKGLLTFKGVLTGVDYVIRELIAPAGSEVSEQPIQITYEIGDNGNAKIGNFVDGSGTAKLDEEGNIVWYEPSTQAVFYKKDEDGNLLAGATLRITNEDGSRVEGIDDWVTDDQDGHLIQKILAAGQNYILQEIEAPDGYELAEPVPFTMTDKAVSANANYIQEKEMTDKAIVDDDDDDDNDDDNDNGNSKKKSKKTKSAKTGDPVQTSMVVMLLILAVGAVVGMITIVIRRRRRS